jgi:DNA-binding response OmpR family regulator
MRVLVADDDPTYRELLRNLLADWHFEMAIVEDGRAAWELLRADEGFRIVILDWAMPNMDGCEVCQRVRELGRDDTYILLMTSNPNKEEVLRVLIAGADDYLAKPFAPAELKVHLRMATRLLSLQDELKARDAGVERGA